MSSAPSRRAWLLLAGIAAAIGALIWASFVTSTPAGSHRTATPAGSHPHAGKNVGPNLHPRSSDGLNLDATKDIAADPRPPDERRSQIIRHGLDSLQEMKFMHPAVFDDAAKRWGEQPRVKELIARWKVVEESWKTQDDTIKATVAPEMAAMWNEAIALLRQEVERSETEARPAAPAGALK
jgi:hypothetical protein